MVITDQLSSQSNVYVSRLALVTKPAKTSENRRFVISARCVPLTWIAYQVEYSVACSLALRPVLRKETGPGPLSSGSDVPGLGPAVAPCSECPRSPNF